MLTDKISDKSVSDWMTELGTSVPAEPLADLTKYTALRLRPYQRAVANVIYRARTDHGNFRSKSLDEHIAAVKAELIRRVNELKSEIMRQPEFRKLETAHTFVENRVFQKDGQGLKVRVMNVTLADLREDFADAGTVDRSNVYHFIVANEYHRPGGNCNRVVHLVEEMGPSEIDVISHFADMAEEAHFALTVPMKPGIVCPTDLSSGADPETFAGLSRVPDNIRREYKRARNANIRAFQQEGRASRVLFGVTRAIGRRPYHPDANPAIGSPYFEEYNEPLYVPSTSMAAMSIGRAYTAFGNGSRISGYFNGGKHVLPSVVRDGEVMTMDCIVNEKQEQALHDAGLYAPVPWKGMPYAVAFDSPSAFVPGPEDDPQESANLQLASRLAYQMLAVELGHQLKRELRYARGSTMNANDIAELIERQFRLKVTPDANAASEETLARKPLMSVAVTVSQSKPGCYTAHADITPHPLLSEAHVTLKLKAELSQTKS